MNLKVRFDNDVVNSQGQISGGTYTASRNGWLLPALLVATVCFSGCVTPLRNSQPVFSPRNLAPSNRRPAATAQRAIHAASNDQTSLRPAIQTSTGNPTASGQIVRGQNPDPLWGMPATTTQPGVSPYGSAPVVGTAGPSPYAASPVPGTYPAAAYPAPSAVPPAGFPGAGTPIWGGAAYTPTTPFAAPVGPPVEPSGLLGLPTNLADIIVNVQETQTGRFMIGAAVNSDAGVTGQIVIDERNFDWRAVPHSVDEFLGGGAFRGAGQGLRIEAMPGSQVQRYMVQFTEPYLLDTRISMNLSGYLFDRQFFDWDEQRLGGRAGLGYRVTPDMSLSATVRAEQVEISRPRVPGVPELDAAVGDHDIFSGGLKLIQDTRDIPFQPSQGYYFEVGYEQVFGSFDYARFDVDWRRYFLLAERPDGSGRHVFGFSNKLGFSGEDTPIFENYFAGGFSTLRGFDFRRASPQSATGQVTVGGRFQFLGSAEYLFPITADDMVKGVAFVDYGTVEEDIKIESEDFRVAIGIGLRVNIPAMGPAPIALDFAVPISREESDEIRGFSFSLGTSR